MFNPFGPIKAPVGPIERLAVVLIVAVIVAVPVVLAYLLYRLLKK